MSEVKSTPVTVEKYLANLTFQKTLLGANPADVQACLEDIICIHHDEMMDAHLAYCRAIERLKQMANVKYQDLGKQLIAAKAQAQHAQEQLAQMQNQPERQSMQIDKESTHAHVSTQNDG